MGLLSKVFGAREKVIPTHVSTAKGFQEHVLSSRLPVIVDVWGPACGPCQKLAPILVDVATRHRDRVRVVEISTDGDGELLSRLGVRSTPTIIIFHGGKEMGRMVGFRPSTWFDEMIKTEFPEE